jgi:hypothetical protein
VTFDVEAYQREAAALLKLPANLDPRGYQEKDWREVWSRCEEAHALPTRYLASIERNSIASGPATEQARDISARAQELASLLRKAGPDLREHVALNLSAHVQGIQPRETMLDPERFPAQPDALTAELEALAGLAGEMADAIGVHKRKGKGTIGNRLTPERELWVACDALAFRCECSRRDGRKLAFLAAGRYLMDGRIPAEDTWGQDFLNTTKIKVDR